MKYDGRAGAVLFAHDMQRVAAFYASVLGLDRVGGDESHVVLESPGFQLVVHRIPDHIASTMQVAVPPVRRASAAVKLVFFVPSVAEVRQVAEQHGGALDSPDREWVYESGKVCDGLDPEGNVVQFREMA